MQMGPVSKNCYCAIFIFSCNITGDHLLRKEFAPVGANSFKTKAHSGRVLSSWETSRNSWKVQFFSKDNALDKWEYLVIIFFNSA